MKVKVTGASGYDDFEAELIGAVRDADDNLLLVLKFEEEYVAIHSKHTDFPA